MVRRRPLPTSSPSPPAATWPSGPFASEASAGGSSIWGPGDATVGRGSGSSLSSNTGAACVGAGAAAGGFAVAASSAGPGAVAPGAGGSGRYSVGAASADPAASTRAGRTAGTNASLDTETPLIGWTGQSLDPP